MIEIFYLVHCISIKTVKKSTFFFRKSWSSMLKNRDKFFDNILKCKILSKKLKKRILFFIERKNKFCACCNFFFIFMFVSSSMERCSLLPGDRVHRTSSDLTALILYFSSNFFLSLLLFCIIFIYLFTDVFFSKSRIFSPDYYIKFNFFAY